MSFAFSTYFALLVRRSGAIVRPLAHVWHFVHSLLSVAVEEAIGMSSWRRFALPFVVLSCSSFRWILLSRILMVVAWSAGLTLRSWFRGFWDFSTFIALLVHRSGAFARPLAHVWHFGDSLLSVAGAIGLSRRRPGARGWPVLRDCFLGFARCWPLLRD